MIYQRYFAEYIKQFNHLDRQFWNYEDGCVLIGLEALYQATKEEVYFESIQNFIDRYVGEDGTIQQYDYEEFNIDRIPSGRVLFLLYEKTKKEKYRVAMESLMKQIRLQPRTKCGNFWHKKIYPYQIWLDGLYMGLPYYMLYENAFENEKHYDDILNQFKNVRKYLYDEEKKLYYHAFDESKAIFWANKESGLSPNFWSRAMGWYFMAITDCYELLPESEREHREYLKELLKEALDGVLQYQDKESSLFYQLTSLESAPGNYLETSASLMIAYALLKGYRLDLLPFSYRQEGEKILLAVELRQFTMSNGTLSLGGMCKGAGLGPSDNLRRDGSVEYYLAEEVVFDEQKGTGAAMMAYGEWLMLKNKEGIRSIGCPNVDIYNGGYELLR